MLDARARTQTAATYENRDDEWKKQLEPGYERVDVLRDLELFFACEQLLAITNLYEQAENNIGALNENVGEAKVQNESTFQFMLLKLQNERAAACAHSNSRRLPLATPK